MARAKIGDPIPISPGYDRNASVKPYMGPRCYICGRLFRKGERVTWVATDIDLYVFVAVDAAIPAKEQYGIEVGSACMKGIPAAAVIESYVVGRPSSANSERE